jgi:ankyrin repeat protein
LHEACQRNFADVVQELLNCRALDPNAQDANGDTPAHYAARNHAQQSFEVLAQSHTVFFDVLNKAGMTPLEMARLEAILKPSDR